MLSKSSVNDDGIITWVFEENSFIPTAKFKNNKTFSILTDHLGTPTSMHNEEGETTWERSLDSNGKVKTGDNSSCPFLFQGQYYDAEIELAYNRFRYYNPDDGRYISVDPIGLLSGEFGFYNYVDNSNGEIDIFGLASYKKMKNDGSGLRKKPGPKKKRGRPKKKDATHGNSVHSKKPRQHYVIEDQDGVPYHGVGDTKGKRANESLDRLNDLHDDKDFTIKSQTNHPTSLDALKGEARGIESTGGSKSSGNYNNINSPGAPYI
uniref:RHS repeat domain-containing protein n=1 Tax=Tenacibaculum finnmarkense TaxID=2781243 RepID=UPI00374D243E